MDGVFQQVLSTAGGGNCRSVAGRIVFRSGLADTGWCMEWRIFSRSGAGHDGFVRLADSAAGRGLRLPFLLVCLLAAWLPSPSLLADDAGRITDAPIAVPDSLLKKMDTFRLRPEAGAAVIGYTAGEDAALIRSWLRSEGYLDAEVDASVEAGVPRWRVRAGELWRIRHVEVVPAVTAGLPLPTPGDAFRSEAYTKAKTALLWSWLDAGHLRAAYARAAVIPDYASRQVDIIWHIEPGPLFYISDIHIEGARQYAPELALRASRLQAGQVPTLQRLQEARQRLADDSRYQHALVVPQLQQATDNRVPLVITVSESGRRRLSGDVGFSTDSGLGLGAAWVDRSPFRGRIEYSLRGEVSRTASGAGGTVILPFWPANDQQIGFNTDYYRADTDGRRYNSLSGGPFWQRDFQGRDHLRLSLQAEQVREAGLRLLTLGPRIDLHLSRQQGALLPSGGWRLDAGAGLPLRLGDSGLWLVMDMVGRLFYRPAGWLLLSPRAGYGRTLNLQGTVPKSYRQFAGGAASVRGYALDSLGPVGVDGLATGGLMKAFAGLDLVLLPEAETFSPVLFADVARLWQAVGSNAPTVWSAGVGGIVHTPAGPLRLDLALPLKRRPQDARFQFYITLGEVL